MKDKDVSPVTNTSVNKDVELLSLLKRLEIFDGNNAENFSYSLDTSTSPEFVRSTLTRSLSNCYENIRRLDTFEDDLFKIIANAQVQLCQNSGGVIFSEDEINHPFFAHPGHLTSLHGHWCSRGPLYYIFSDTFMKKDEIIVKMQEEYEVLRQNISLLSDAKTTQRQRIAYLDYLKNFFLIVYHASSYLDRFGKDEDALRIHYKDTLRKASEEFTRMYYRALLDKTVDHASVRNELECVELQWSALVNYFNTSKDFESGWFKYAELDDPIVILKAAYSFVKESSKIDVIIGIESGGTELCFATKLLYQLMGHTNFVRTELVALSRYTLQRSTMFEGVTTPIEIVSSQVAKLNVKSSNVLVVDDNSNTGESAQLVYHALQQVPARKVRVRVAEFDLHRSMFKHLNWEKKPDHIAHPDLFLCSVGVTPITQGLDEFLPFRQQRKIMRTQVLQDFFKQDIQRQKTTIKAGIKDIPRMKLCGIHNSVDFVNAWNSGVKWFGVHCLYDDEQYKEKIAGFPRAHQFEYKMNLDFKIGESSGLPLAEIGSLRGMLQLIEAQSLNANVVFLIDGTNKKTIPALFKHVIPKDYHGPLYFQLQNKYSNEVIERVQKQARKFYKHDINLIQTFGSSEDLDLLAAADNDERVSLLLIDYKQYGGTGKSIKDSQLRNILRGVRKQFFIAGGVNANTVRRYVDLIGDYSTNFSIDLESSIEPKAAQPGFFVGDSNECMIVRKSPDLIAEMCNSWQAVLEELQYIRLYEALDLEGSVFKEKLNQSWLEAKEEKGFFAVRLAMEKHARKMFDDPFDEGYIEKMVHELLNYNRLPGYYRRQQDLAPQYQRTEQQPWLINEVSSFFGKLKPFLDTETLGLYIWTAGEDPSNSKKSYEQALEQKLKFLNSGLRDCMLAAGLKEDEHFKVIAAPDKIPLLKKNLVDVSTDKKIIIADDKAVNLTDAKKILTKLGFKDVQTFIVGHGNKHDGHVSVKSVAEIPELIGNFSNTIFFCDMDGVLIHEEFRNEHQPKNLYLNMIEMHGFQGEVEIYGQRQSPLKVDYEKIATRSIEYDKTMIIFTAHEPHKILLPVRPIGGIFDECQRVSGVTTTAYTSEKSALDEYVNDAYFKKLIQKGDLVEYGFKKEGYTGTSFAALNKCIDSGVNGIMLLEASAARLMVKLLPTMGIKVYTIFIRDPERDSDDLGIFDYVINNNESEIRKTVEKICKSNKE